MIILLSAQDKPKSRKIKESVVVDTVTIVIREADTLYLQQSIILNKLDSLIKEQKEKQ